MNKKAHYHRSIRTNSIEDANIFLELKFSNLRSLSSRTVIHNFANLAVANNPNVGLVPVPSARLKSEGRMIASESKRALHTW